MKGATNILHYNKIEMALLVNVFYECIATNVDTSLQSG